ncbi:LuxR C-terminal-related transcriptional regulator [Luedemannella helvata]|uniref:LuxR C-terminal-related transcriptional regulator n=1 Tax=Luedemannella helvata TaxID=349315 RepID=A0ABN2JU21_9ACTN
MAGLAAAGLDVREYLSSAIPLVGAVIPYDGACFGTADPDTELLTHHQKVGLPDDRDFQFVQYEYETDDVNKFTDIARRDTPVGLLSHDTGGDPQRSRRYREIINPHYSYGHELRTVCRYDNTTWGMGTLYRAPQSPGFSMAETDVLGRLAPLIALGLRSALVASAADTVNTTSGPAVVIVDGDNQVSQASVAAAERVAELGGDLWGELPTTVSAVVSAARAYGSGRSSVLPRTRHRTRSGRWLIVHASPLAARDGQIGQVVVTIEEAGPPDVVPLVIAAFGLTGRERDVVTHVLQGAGTAEIASSLHLSPHTVQDHLKNIFDKAGVRSRRALIARVFFDHYQPRNSGNGVPVTATGRLSTAG